jgi:hypothetical protein
MVDVHFVLAQTRLFVETVFGHWVCACQFTVSTDSRDGSGKSRGILPDGVDRLSMFSTVGVFSQKKFMDIHLLAWASPYSRKRGQYSLVFWTRSQFVKMD